MRYQQGEIALRIDIGCGSNKKSGFTGIDKVAAPGVDVVIDFESERLPFGDNEVDAIYSSHCLEHLSDPHLLLSELLRVGRDGASFELWLPYLKSNDAFVFGHRMYYNELIVARISATAPGFWFQEIDGAMRLDRVIYVLKSGIAEELKPLRVPLHFAIKHLFNIVVEWGLYFTILKGPAYRDRRAYTAAARPPGLFVSYGRAQPRIPLDAPADFWELR